MTSIFSLPSEFVSQVLDVELEDDAFISVFSTYSQEDADYFLDRIIYNINDDEELEVIKGNTRVVYHKKENDGINLSRYEITPREITVSKGIDKETFLGGEPNFLQDKIELDGCRFLMQFYAGNFPSEYKNVLFLADAIGYIFIEKDVTIDKPCGLYFGQST